MIVVGSPGSGKDELVRAVNRLGRQHAEVVPKHTDRARNKKKDGKEMICPGDRGFALEACDLVYENFGSRYGIQTRRIWAGLRSGVFQVAVVSNVSAINNLRRTFGELVVLVYVHSEVTPDQYRTLETCSGYGKQYVESRARKYRMAFDAYLENYLAFDHVFIYVKGAEEDLYDQIFRAFRAYERGLL